MASSKDETGTTRFTARIIFQTPAVVAAIDQLVLSPTTVADFLEVRKVLKFIDIVPAGGSDGGF